MKVLTLVKNVMMVSLAPPGILDVLLTAQLKLVGNALDPLDSLACASELHPRQELNKFNPFWLKTLMPVAMREISQCLPLVMVSHMFLVLVFWVDNVHQSRVVKFHQTLLLSSMISQIANMFVRALPRSVPTRKLKMLSTQPSPPNNAKRDSPRCPQVTEMLSDALVSQTQSKLGNIGVASPRISAQH